MAIHSGDGEEIVDHSLSLVAAKRMGKGVEPLPVILGDGIEDPEPCFEPPEVLDLPI